MDIRVISEIASQIHINFTLCLIFHIHANTLKLNAENIVNNVNITQYDNKVPENANLVHSRINPISFQSGIIKLISSIKAILKYV